MEKNSGRLILEAMTSEIDFENRITSLADILMIYSAV